MCSIVINDSGSASSTNVYSPIAIRKGDSLYVRSSKTVNGVTTLTYSLVNTPTKSYKIVSKQLDYNDYIALLKNQDLFGVEEEYTEYQGEEVSNEEEDNMENTKVENTEIIFSEDPNTGYAERTKRNASADATIALAYDFNSAGEKLTRKSVEGQNKKYIGMVIPNKSKASQDLQPSQIQVDRIVNDLNEVNAKTLNIAGNGIYTMREADYSQEEVDLMVYNLLKAVVESPNLKNKLDHIRTGGQTGFDEAGAKAGIKLGIKTYVLAPKGWKFRNIDGQDISNEQQFKARFNTQTTEVKDPNLDTNEIIKLEALLQEYEGLSARVDKLAQVFRDLSFSKN